MPKKRKPPGHRADRPTLMLDRRIPGLGRIQRSSGTSDPRLYAAVLDTFKVLFEWRRLDYLRAIRDGHLEPLDAYALVRDHGIERLPAYQAQCRAVPLRDAFDAWLPRSERKNGHALSERTRADYRALADRLIAEAPKATVEDLPAVLKRLRESWAGGRTFNQLRAVCMAFARQEFGNKSPFWLAVAGVNLRAVTHWRKHGPLAPDEAREVVRALGPLVGPMFWTLCCTGMTPQEYIGDGFEAGDGRIAIHGRKRAGRERVIPRITTPVRPSLGKRHFAAKLSAIAADPPLTPYVARRTFAHWCDLAGIPRPRRKRYMGHGTDDVLALYEDHGIESHLAADADRLRAVVGAEPHFLEKVG